MASFHNPSTSPVFRVFPFGGDLPAYRFHMRRVVSLNHDFCCLPPCIPFVRAKMLRRLIGNLGPFDDHRIQNFFQLSDIMEIGSGHDERERDATLFHQQISFASFFFPDPLDCVQPPLAPGGLCSLRHQCSANSRKFLPSHRIRPNRLAIISEIHRPFPRVESSRGLSWNCQNVPWAMPSTGNPYAKHRQFLRRRAGPPLACARPRLCVYIAYSDRGLGLATMAVLAPKKHRRLPMIESSASFPP